MVQVSHCGLLAYKATVELQEKYVNDIYKENANERLLLLEHPHVITIGRSGNIQNLLFDKSRLKEKGVEFYETGRGGDITYHGPGQLVGYPILKLSGSEKDVRKYLDKIEEVIILTLEDYGISAKRIEGLTGVWVRDEKIAAIGVRFSRWITSHGFALNVNPDLSYFQLITPCGIADKGVTSMKNCLGRDVDLSEVSKVLLKHFSNVFHRELEEGYVN